MSGKRSVKLTSEQRARLCVCPSGEHLPTARVHDARAPRMVTVTVRILVPWMLCVVAGVLCGNLALYRASESRAWAAVARSEARLARAEARQAAIVHRDVKPVNDPRVEVCVRRTTALRGAILGLVRTGKVSLVGDPGGEWAAWPLELAEVRR